MAAAKLAKVFWFFFSKKNCFSCLTSYLFRRLLSKRYCFFNKAVFLLVAPGLPRRKGGSQ
jgi:hypothetical protein